MKKLLPLIILTTTLGACASAPPKKNDCVDVAIAKAANSATKSIQDLARIEQAQNPTKIPLMPVDTKSYGMGAISTVQWSGPMEPLLKQIAKQTGYELKIIGPRPAIPIIVTLNQENVPIGDILQNAALQANNQETVVVFPGQNGGKGVIQLSYNQ